MNNFPQTNLQPGTRGDAVKQLQQFLISKGIDIPDGATGYYGNQTKAAVAKWQRQNGVQAGNDAGFWGPKSIAVAGGQPTTSTVQQAQTTPKIDANTQLTKDQLDALNNEYATAIPTSPATQPYTAYNTPESILNAYLSGDWSGVSDSTGKPFSIADQQAALASSEEALKPYYEQEKLKGTQDAEAAMKQKQLDYQNYLDTQATKFQEEKANLDQTAANQGVLFSGGRAQKEKQLQGSYEQAQTYKQASTGADIGSTAREYGYKFGTPAANSLSQYYNLGSNTYNPNVATGGVSKGGLSSIYSTGGTDYYGTQNVAQKRAAQERASGLLWNKGNKLLSTGYKNQY